jgi:hypothetical protein
MRYAALEVIRIFYNLLPKDDKEKLENLDYLLINLIKNDTGFKYGVY